MFNWSNLMKLGLICLRFSLIVKRKEVEHEGIDIDKINDVGRIEHKALSVELQAEIVFGVD